MSTEVKKPLFETLYEGAKDAIKAMKAPLVERSFKRKFQSMYDDAERIIDETNMKLFEERQKLQDADINLILKYKREIKKANELREELKAEYLDMFGEELK